MFTAAARGAAHVLAGLPLQDAVGDTEADGRVCLAVADGHGDRQHFRSDRGSRLAVEAGLGAAAALGAGLAARPAAAAVRSAAQAELVPAVTHWWRQAVERDLALHPLSPGEQRLVLAGRSAWTPYGSTLVLAVLASPWLVLCQIGDGDVVVVGADGVAALPVPGDPVLDGQRTTSLCQTDATASFRVAVRDLAHEPLAVLLLATDGFGNAHTADRWQQIFGADLLRLLRRHGSAWVGRQLPAWVARCASAEGSGDDSAAAVLLPEDRPVPARPGPASDGRPA